MAPPRSASAGPVLGLKGETLYGTKILGSLVGVALGDALGMPTEFMTQQSISDIYGEVREFRTPPIKITITIIPLGVLR